MTKQNVLREIRSTELPDNAFDIVFGVLGTPAKKYGSILNLDAFKTKMEDTFSECLPSADYGYLLGIKKEVPKELVHPALNSIFRKAVKLLFEQRVLNSLRVKDKKSGYSWIVALNRRAKNITRRDAEMLKASIFQEGVAPSVEEVSDMRAMIQQYAPTVVDTALNDYTQAARCGGFYEGFMDSLSGGDKLFKDGPIGLEIMDDDHVRDAYVSALNFSQGGSHVTETEVTPEPEEVTPATEVEVTPESDAKVTSESDVEVSSQPKEVTPATEEASPQPEEKKGDSVPQTHEKATESAASAEQKAAMKKTLAALAENGTYEKVPREQAGGVYPTGWEYFKEDGELKARVKVVEQDTPKMSFACMSEHLAVVLSLAAHKHLKVFKLHCKDAILDTPVDFPIYVEPPAGSAEESKFVWKLNKGMFGMPGDPELLGEYFGALLEVLGLVHSQKEHYLYFQRGYYVIVSGEDFLVCTKDDALVNMLFANLTKAKLDVSQEVNPRTFMGFNLEYKNQTIKLTMKDAIDNLGTKYGIAMTDKPSSPLSVIPELLGMASPLLRPEASAQYKSAVGELDRLARALRFDIGSAVAKLTGFTKRPTELHMEQLTNIVQYLNNTKDMGIVLGGKGSLSVPKTRIGPAKRFQDSGIPKLQFVCSADVANERMGYLILLSGSIIGFSSVNMIFRPKTEAEGVYVSISQVLTLASITTGVLDELGVLRDGIEIYGDSANAFSQLVNGTDVKLPMMFEGMYRRIREMIMKQDDAAAYLISKDDNFARITTTFGTDPQHMKWLKMAMS